jgi:flagellar biosynthesis/type III secretory pathway M-ring protein FliF/YscJ
MFVMTENANPFNYMSDLWYVLIVVLVLVAVLLLIARPLHRIYTDRKTRQIIKESGVEEDTGGSAGGDAPRKGGEGHEAADD